MSTFFRISITVWHFYNCQCLECLTLILLHRKWEMKCGSCLWTKFRAYILHSLLSLQMKTCMVFFFLTRPVGQLGENALYGIRSF